MDLQGKTILILGGSGLVGRAVARRLLTLQPGKLVLVGLFENELRAEAAALAPHAGTATIEYEWGNAFLPTEVAKLSRAEMLTNEDHRRLVLNDLLDGLSPDVLKRSFLYSLFSRFRPHAVVDCINTATAFAYQDVFASSRKLAQAARQGTVSVELVEEHDSLTINHTPSLDEIHETIEDEMVDLYTEDGDPISLDSFVDFVKRRRVIDRKRNSKSR